MSLEGLKSGLSTFTSVSVRILNSHWLSWNLSPINYASVHIGVYSGSYFISSVVSFWSTNLFLRRYGLLLYTEDNRDGFRYSFLLQCIACRSSRWYPHNTDLEDFRGQAEKADKSGSWQRTRNRRRTNRDCGSGIYKSGTRTWWEVLLIMVSCLFIYLYIFIYFH